MNLSKLKKGLLVSNLALAQLSFAEITNLDSVDPTIGNVAPFLKPTYPTFHLPNQMLRVFPIKESYLDDQIEALPLQVISHRKKGFIHLNVARSEESIKGKSKMSIDHDLEINKPWFYQTYLIEQDVTVRFVPSAKSAIYHLTFPEKTSALLSLSGSPKIQFSQLTDNSVIVEEKFTFERERDEWLKPSTMSIWAYCQLTDDQGEPVKDVKLSVEDNRLIIRGTENTPSNIQLRYGISYISGEKAKEHYSKELGTLSFDSLVETAQTHWKTDLDRILVEGGTTSQRRSFYTALYKTYERMVDINEGGEYYSGYSKQVEPTQQPMYVDDWVWDSYRTHHPLRLLLKPKQQVDILNSYNEMCRLNSGRMPTFPQVYGNSPCMNCFHSSSLFLDAKRKGLTGFDLEQAYTGIEKNMNEGTWIPWRQGTPRTPLDDKTEELGYVPALHKGQPETEPVVDEFEKRQSVAVTLGRSYDGWVMTELSRELNKTSKVPYYDNISKDYLKLWRPEQKLFMPKDEQGNWIDINPKLDGGAGFRDYFDENNGWTYAWGVPHDIAKLIELNGGPEQTIQNLDQLFREPLGTQRHVFHHDGPDSTGMVGQFSMGNEPSFHIPYLYNYCGKPWKTQQRIRFLLDVWFKDNIFGIPGDEDGGTMSAWIVWASIGLYPVTPGTPEYSLSSPLFSKVTIPLENGKEFTISSPGTSRINKYIQSATLNGQPLNTPFISHQNIINGGELVLELSDKPSHTWGTER